MAFVKADLKNEKEELDKLVAELSQQAVSRIETGSGATISSLIKYHIGIAVLHFYDQSKIYES